MLYDQLFFTSRYFSHYRSSSKRNYEMPKMKLWILLWAWAGLILGLTAASQISIDPDGGYKGIVIQIQKNVPEEKCPQILSNLKVRQLLLSTLMMIMVKIGHDMSLGLGKDWKCEFVVGNVVHL